MSVPQLSAEGPPAIFMDERLVERAMDLGAVSINAYRTGIEETVRFATHGGTVQNLTGRDLGGVVIWNIAKFSDLTKERLVQIPENGSLEEAKDGERIRLVTSGKMADEANVTLLDIFNRTPTEAKLTHGLYNSANRLTTNNATHICSKNDKWFGTAMGFGLGLFSDFMNQLEGIPSPSELTDVPYATGGVAGLIAGRLLLAPALSMLRRANDLKIVRRNDTMPFRIGYATA